MMKDELSGADIKAICSEAGMLALRERRMRVTKAVRVRYAAVNAADAGQDFDAARESTLYRKKVRCLALLVL